MDILAINNLPETIAAHNAAIREQALRPPTHMDDANFQRIGDSDLRKLFNLYDGHYFSGDLARMLAARSPAPLSLRLSSTMTRSGGKTLRIRPRNAHAAGQDRYEIAIASRLLFMTFGTIQRPVMIGGLPCTNRLEALQRIMEHEILHLVELLCWGKSNCAGDRYKTLARRIFGHSQSCHSLVTPHEAAVVNHGIRVGQTVEFDFEGQRFVGRVNRIHHRATVLVESPDGQPYSDGRRYRKYYMPLPMLRPA